MAKVQAGKLSAWYEQKLTFHCRMVRYAAVQCCNDSVVMTVLRRAGGRSWREREWTGSGGVTHHNAAVATQHSLAPGGRQTNPSGWGVNHDNQYLLKSVSSCVEIYRLASRMFAKLRYTIFLSSTQHFLHKHAACS